jgi:molecular chaperone GrpE
VSKEKNTPIKDAENIPENHEDGVEAAAIDETTADKTAVQDGRAAFEQALGEAQKQARDYFEGWQRERADFSNYKKRAERDLMTMRFNAKIDTLKTFLPVLDDFERAMANLPDTTPSDSWLEGIRAIQRKLLKTLEDEGVQTIDPTGELFDPNLHEAIGQDSDSDVASGHVSATLQKGYICGDRVLRPALVRVAE